MVGSIQADQGILVPGDAPKLAISSRSCKATRRWKTWWVSLARTAQFRFHLYLPKPLAERK